MNAYLHDDDCRPSMAFQEKRAWLTLASGVAIYGAFVATVLADADAGLSVMWIMILFTIAMTVQGVIVGVSSPLLALRDPGEARAPLDERDRTVARKAMSAAYITLVIEVVLLAFAAPYLTASWQISFAAFLATIMADMVRMIAIVINYRRRNV